MAAAGQPWGALLDAQRWTVRPVARGFGLVRLLPSREFGPQPGRGDELVPAAALDKAIGVLEQTATGRIPGGSDAEVLSHVRSLAADALKDLKA